MWNEHPLNLIFSNIFDIHGLGVLFGYISLFLLRKKFLQPMWKFATVRWGVALHLKKCITWKGLFSLYTSCFASTLTEGWTHQPCGTKLSKIYFIEITTSFEITIYVIFSSSCFSSSLPTLGDSLTHCHVRIDPNPDPDHGPDHLEHPNHLDHLDHHDHSKHPDQQFFFFKFVMSGQFHTFAMF